jgi:hypothetical protein
MRAGAVAREAPPAGKHPRRASRLALAAGAAGYLAPLAVLVAFVTRYSVNLPFSDQWDFVNLIERSKTSGVGLGDLFAQHYEQRMLFPRLIMLVMAPVTHWNTRAEMYVDVLLAIAISVLLLLLIRRTLAPLGGWVVIPGIVVSILVFSLVQWEDWFWGWQISWFLPLFCMVAAVTALALWPEGRPVLPAVALSAAAGVVGQYSLLSGTLIWLVCIPVMLVRMPFRRFILPWLAVGAVSTLLYMRGYVSPPGMASFRAPPLPELLHHPQTPLHYIFYYLGRPVLSTKPSYWVGEIFVAAFAATAAFILLWRRDRLERAVPWFAIAGYTLAASVLTMLGRMGLGLDLAGSSRYTTIGVLFMVSTLGLVSVAIMPEAEIKSPWIALGAAVAIWLVVAALFLGDTASEVTLMKQWYADKLAIRACLDRVQSAQDPCLLQAYPQPEPLFEHVRYLQKIGWGGFKAYRAP